MKLRIQTPAVFNPLFKPDQRYLGAYGGRGSGKSHHFAERLIEELIRFPKARAVCVREIQKSLKESAYRLLSDKVQTLRMEGLFDVKNDEIRTTKGGVIVFQGMQDHTAESIKSLEGFKYAWVEEAQTMSERSLELLRPTIRIAGSQLWFSWNPRVPTDAVDKFLRGIHVPEGTTIVRCNHYDNPWFPKELEAERLFDKRYKPDRYSHIWEGDYEPQAVGAIWMMANINETRVESRPNDLTRVLVSVDPATSSEEHSDEHGITVGGISETGHGYLLQDATTKGSPSKWARRAIAMYDLWGADAIVVEKNQGGDMCKHTLQSVRPGIPVILVHASRGKHARAEPVSALYDISRVHHVGHDFSQLEAQMCQMTSGGYEGEGSPDRVDSLVWLFTELFPDIIRKPESPMARQQVAMNEYDEMDPNGAEMTRRFRQTIAEM
jgi:phage terminase large subunit-like protein